MKVQNLLNANRDPIFPVTHEKLVFDDNGVRLSTKLDRLNGISGRNLLDNWDFRNAVNRNNLDVYTGVGWSGSIHTIDRWNMRGIGAKLTVNADGVYYEKTNDGDGYAIFEQSITAESLVGNALTASAIIDDGVLLTATCPAGWSNNITDDKTIAVYYHYDGDKEIALSIVHNAPDNVIRVRFYYGATYAAYTTGFNLRAVKLELGEQSTLMNDAPANYAEQYSICCQYDNVTGEFIGLTAKEVGALPVANDGTIPEAVTVKSATPIIGVVHEEASVMAAVTVTDNGTAQLVASPVENSNAAILELHPEADIKSTIQLAKTVDDVTTKYAIYGEHNAPLNMTIRTLSKSGWNAQNMQSVTVNGILADDTKQFIQATPVGSSMAIAMNYGVLCSSQSENTLTFACTEVPTDDVVFCITWQFVNYIPE